VHPDDPRYLHLHDKTAVLPLLHRELRIVADTMVDPKFGTGVVKITPAHDPNDFEAGKRHGLPSVRVINEDARMTAAAGPYSGLDRFEARKRIVTALEASGELVKTEAYTVNLSKCSRCKSIIEPLISMQWFLRMRGLADRAMEAVRSGRIRFVPDDREVVFFQWMENIRDWCISRQLWWGHRIPAWHCRNCGQTTVAREAPATCPYCQSTELEQETDVLDTWFSSGLWPFSTLGWPEETADLKTYYPTTLMICGFDILFFWVSRMMMLGIEMTGDVPFREVHLHGLVRDAEKQKISKTKGNTIDPLLMMDKYGTDACRIGLLISASAGADIALKEDRLEASRAFANKLWNASRLLFLNLERSKVTSWTPAPFPEEHFEDTWIYARLNEAAATVNAALASHRYHEGAQTLWNFVWHEFCDWYLEVKKLRFKENSGQDAHWTAALTIYEAMLRLLHPFMPFITEELWQRLVHAVPGERQVPVSISLASYPTAAQTHIPSTAFPAFQQAVTAARELRADNKLDAKAILPAAIYLHGSLFNEGDLALLANLTRLDIRQLPGAISDRSGLIRSTPDFDLQIQAAAPSANGTAGTESVSRISKEISTLERNIENSKRQLADETFLSRAPEKVIAGLRTKLAEYEVQLKKNKDLLEGLG
jgi:valyl-tRNA synthetase